MVERKFDLSDIIKKVELYLSVNRFDAAEKLLKATLADYGPLANIYNLLGTTFHKQSKFPEAIENFNRALATNPKFIEAALNLTATLCDVSRYDDAREVFQKTYNQITSPKKVPDLVLGRLANQHGENGYAYEASGMLAEAVQEYRRALTLYPQMPDVNFALAKLYMKLKQFEKARVEFENLAKSYPSLPAPQLWLGVLYYKLGKLDLSKKIWDKIKTEHPDYKPVRSYLKIANDWPVNLHEPI